MSAPSPARESCSSRRASPPARPRSPRRRTRAAARARKPAAVATSNWVTSSPRLRPTTSAPSAARPTAAANSSRTDLSSRGSGSVPTSARGAGRPSPRPRRHGLRAGPRSSSSPRTCRWCRRRGSRRSGAGASPAARSDGASARARASTRSARASRGRPRGPPQLFGQLLQLGAVAVELLALLLDHLGRGVGDEAARWPSFPSARATSPRSSSRRASTRDGPRRRRSRPTRGRGTADRRPTAARIRLARADPRSNSKRASRPTNSGGSTPRRGPAARSPPAPRPGRARPAACGSARFPPHLVLGRGLDQRLLGRAETRGRRGDRGAPGGRTRSPR